MSQAPAPQVRVRSQAATPDTDSVRHPRSTKLSDVKELAEFEGEAARFLQRTRAKAKRQSYAGPRSKRPTSRNGRAAWGTGSLRSPPPAWQGPAEYSPDLARIALPLMVNDGWLDSADETWVCLPYSVACALMRGDR